MVRRFTSAILAAACLWQELDEAANDSVADCSRVSVGYTGDQEHPQMTPPFSVYGSERSLPPRLRLSRKGMRQINDVGQLSIRARMAMIEEDQRRRKMNGMSR